MILTLDDPACLDETVSGAKAAWLARARRAGLPVLEGVVVAASESSEAMAFGASTMEARGSGGARLAMIARTLPAQLISELATAVSSLREPLVVRSSTTLEGTGEWSGAFTSYLDIARSELDTAVRGCWASAFTVHALERFQAAGLEPGSVPMAVLVQPALDAEFGGTARIESSGDVVVVGIAGSPAPLVQGWEPGAHARVAPDGRVGGREAVALMGEDLVRTVADLLHRARATLGATSCEWAAVGGDVTLFQLLGGAVAAEPAVEVPAGLADPLAARLARVVRRAPGPLGEALVLPWAVADPERFLEPVPPVDVDPREALQVLSEHAKTLTAEVWGLPKAAASGRAAEVLRVLRSSDPAPALEAIRHLSPPDPVRAGLVLGLLARVRSALADAGAVADLHVAWHLGLDAAGRALAGEPPEETLARVGFDRWEPFDIGVVTTHGQAAVGVPAAPGTASGRLCFVTDAADAASFRPRDVVVGVHPLPNLAALLWDAAALVTTGGGAAAHLFESARALAIPAVCSIHLDEVLGVPLADATGRFSAAVDGVSGQVTVAPW